MKHWLSGLADRIAHWAAAAIAVSAAFQLRFDFSMPAGVLPVWERGLIAAVIVKALVFEVGGFYRGIKQFAGIPDLLRILVGNLPLRLCSPESAGFGSGRPCRAPCWS